MNGRWRACWSLMGLVALAVACVTVNIYFPAAEVQKAADQIVDEVRPESPAPAQESTPADPQSLRRPSLMQYLAALCVTPAEAQVDIDISTPAIRNLKASIKDRFKALGPFYKQGAVGESNMGYLELRDTDALGLKEKSQVKRLVEAENNDRRALYEEIIRANNLDSKVMSEVERLFANSWRQKASGSGWWIQNNDGTWSQ